MTHPITLAPLKTGTLVRCGSAPTALMRIDSISYNHSGPGQHRYYGEHCDGGSHAAFHTHCRIVSAADLDTWNSSRFAPLARSA